MAKGEKNKRERESEREREREREDAQACVDISIFRVRNGNPMVPTLHREVYRTAHRKNQEARRDRFTEQYSIALLGI